jgi:hypothetical protein
MEELERVRSLIGATRVGERSTELDEALDALSDAIEREVDEVRRLTAVIETALEDMENECYVSAQQTLEIFGDADRAEEAVGDMLEAIAATFRSPASGVATSLGEEE